MSQPTHFHQITAADVRPKRTARKRKRTDTSAYTVTEDEVQGEPSIAVVHRLSTDGRRLTRQPTTFFTALETPIAPPPSDQSNPNDFWNEVPYDEQPVGEETVLNAPPVAPKKSKSKSTGTNSTEVRVNLVLLHYQLRRGCRCTMQP